MSNFIVHVVTDDKFVDMALREFEAVAPGRSVAIILGKQRQLQYVANRGIVFLRWSEAKELVNSRLCSAVVFHSLSDDFMPLLEAVSPAKTSIWLGWGYDYYERLLSDAYPSGLLLRKTAALAKNSPSQRVSGAIKGRLRRLVLVAMGRAVRYRPQLLQKIDYFCPVIESEYRLAAQLNPWFRAKYLCWNYGTLEDDLFIDGRPDGPKRDILVGNSATFENNHLEIFEMLKASPDAAGRRILVPLSYGNAWYRQRIIEEGTRMFGPCFIPLVDFMPKQRYMQELDSCGYVFMNHLRQQALGNICIMMLKGAKVFINAASPLYDWLKAKGAAISALSDLSNEAKESHISFSPLSDEQRLVNQQVVKNHWGREVQRERTRRLVDIALEMKSG